MKKISTLLITIGAFVGMAGVAQASVGMMSIATVPDLGSTSALMGIALVGLAAVRRFVR
jgi:hypothetical protein